MLALSRSARRDISLVIDKPPLVSFRPRRSALVVRPEALLQIAASNRYKTSKPRLWLEAHKRRTRDNLAIDLEAGLLLFVGIRFQVSFTPLGGVLFTFPSRYWFAIGR